MTTHGGLARAYHRHGDSPSVFEGERCTLCRFWSPPGPMPLPVYVLNADAPERIEALAREYAEKQVCHRVTNPAAFRNDLVGAFMAGVSALRGDA